VLLAIWRYRHFILASVFGEFKARFARSRIGLFWSVLHPLAQATIFALVLAEVLGAKLGGINDKAAYPIYLMAGMAAWGLFSEIVSRCLSVFIDNAGIMKKIAFPRICLPVIVWASALLNHLLLLGAIVVVFLFFGHYPGVAWLILPVGIVLISMLAFGIGVLLGVLNVFSRDIGQVTTIVLQIWFWLTPIVYPASILPESMRWLLELNPLVPLVGIYQDALLLDRTPDPQTLLVPAIVAMTLFAMSFVLFRRASPELVDAL
jgi:homopolymeric O-antigen transport system permease protein